MTVVENPDVDVAKSPQGIQPEEGIMVRKDVWAEIQRRHHEEKVSIRELVRQFDLDRNTIRRCLRQGPWRPYARPERPGKLLAVHQDYLRARASKVGYSARILYQEMVSQRGYRGSYDTVKLFVRPLREAQTQAGLSQTRFETPPGLQSQVDWGQARVDFRSRQVVQHLFVLTLGFSRRGFYCGYPDERLPQFLEAHERAFEHFGGHTREHLYDRPRTICAPGEGGKVAWNSTFRAFADYWGFEPRLCAPYRAQTKGKVESGVKYVKRNFLPGRRFIDQVDFDAQLTEWMATVADVRVHGTTHEKPMDRFTRERDLLIAAAGRPSFRLEARAGRIVADDFLVSYQTNRYSVPFSLIGQPVEILPRGKELQIFHRGSLVVTHPVMEGKHQMRILPEHGPGPIARNPRLRFAGPAGSSGRVPGDPPEVEVRSLTVYESLLGSAAGEVAS